MYLARLLALSISLQLCVCVYVVRRSVVVLMCVSMLLHTMYSHLPGLLAAVLILAG